MLGRDILSLADSFVRSATNHARMVCVLCAVALGSATPSLVRGQPAPSPTAVTFSRADTIPLSASVLSPADLAERSRMRPVKKGMVIGAVSGAIVGLLASAEIHSGGCDLSLPINADGSPGKLDCSTWRQGLAYGAFLSLVGGTAGGVIGAGVGAVVGVLRTAGEVPNTP